MQKKAIAVLFTALICLMLSVSGCADKTPASQVIYPEGYTALKADVNDTGALTEGLAVEFETGFFNYEQAMRAEDRYFNGVDPEDYWNTVKARLQEMNIARFRMMIKPGWLEPRNDNADASEINWDAFTFDSVEMRAVYRALDLAEELGIKVTLVLWGVEVNYNEAALGYQTDGKYWMVGDNSAQNWCIGAKGDMMYEFVECFSALVQYCVNTKKYTCIDQVTPGNEPDWQWQVDSDRGDPEAYVEMCLELDRRFRADGIRDKVLFNLGDSTDRGSRNWLTEVCPPLAGVADIINTHTYIFSNQSTNSQILDWAKQNRAFASSIGAKYWVGEFGSYADGNDDIYKIDDYSRCIGLARQTVCFMNGGAIGASYWMCADTALHYTRTDVMGSYCIDGLWATYKHIYDEAKVGDAVPEDFYLRKQYYMYRMLSQAIGEGCRVYPLKIDSDYIAGMRLVDASGSETLIVVNGTDEDVRYAFAVSDVKADFLYVGFNENCFTQSGYEACTQPMTVANGCISFTAPSQSVSIIKQNQ